MRINKHLHFCKIRSVRSMRTIVRLRDMGVLAMKQSFHGAKVFAAYTGTTSPEDIQDDIDAGLCYFVAGLK